MRLIPLLLFLLFFSPDGYAQIDTEFWFAPPEVTAGHGDRPIYLRLSTLAEGAVVKVVQPARGNVQVGAANVAANTTQTIDLSAHLSNLETTLAGTVMRTGIRITSTAPITAYYEVGAPFNSEIFALKGRNALGNKFVIPGQNLYHNSGDYNPYPSSSFDIVATQNNTVVKVWPIKPVAGHGQDTLIIVKLNVGETYSFRKLGLVAADNPAGSVVEANKPIAITLKDDSVIKAHCRDLLGDQLVPVEVAGNEYVVLKGFLDAPEYVFITATEHDTRVYIQGGTSPVAVLQAGQVYRHLVTERSTYVLAEKTIYVAHVTGFGCEMGMAILPSINCKGSPQIGFTRTTSEFFGLNILVMKEGISSFMLNGSAALIPPSQFTAVPGTNDKWYTAQLSFNEAEVRVGEASLISNNRYSFQVGIINGNAASTCRYGYFSSFSTLFLGDDLDICEGAVATLDAGPGKESYLWSTGETSPQIRVNAAGRYWVKVEREDCVLYDTIDVSLKRRNIELGPDVHICRGDTARVDGKENFSWRWSDGSSEQILETTEGGKYWVSVFDYTGCMASDTISVFIRERPYVDVGAHALKCREDSVAVDVTQPGALYLWSDGDTTGIRKLGSEGLYIVSVTVNGCTTTDSLAVENYAGPPQDFIYGTPSVCPHATGIAYAVDSHAGHSYQWQVEGGTIRSKEEHSITVDWGATNSTAAVKALITDETGCAGDTIVYPVRINVVLLPEIPFGPDTLCLNKSHGVVYTTPPTNGSEFHWNSTGGTITAGQGNEQVTVDWVEGLNTLWIDESSRTIDTVCHGTSPKLYVYVYKDTADIALHYVSVDTSRTDVINVRWGASNTTAPFAMNVHVLRRSPELFEWHLLAEVPPSQGSFDEQIDVTWEGVHQYQLTLTNSCDELLETAIHNNMFLQGAADSASLSIRLYWNHYVGWAEGPEYYEVWRRLDDEPGYRFLSRVPATENTFSSLKATDGFKHTYVIRAVERRGAFDSWSTAINFAFEHPVVIPNIITPNGDMYNQYFHITNVHLYKNSELTIFDRWGKEVYSAVNYQNDWDGNGLSAGVYYYVLDLKRDKKVYKGPITIF